VGCREPSLNTAILSWQESRRPEAYVDVAGAQLAQGVRAHLLADLGEDPCGGFDEQELHVLRPHVVIVEAGVSGHVLEFG
jgi:hypothetical protein